MDEIKNKIIEFANANGYDYALQIGYWNDYEVYEPIFWDDDVHIIGKPHSILFDSDNDEIRMTTDEECFLVLNEIDNYDRILKNLPIDIESNVTVKSFKFIRGGYPIDHDIYEFKSTKKYGKTLSYNKKGIENILPIEFPLDDRTITINAPFKKKITDKNFDEHTLGMIKYFHEDFGLNPNVMDGEWYDFKATLSNGQKLISSGCNYFPYTYWKFVAYLEHFWD